MTQNLPTTYLAARQALADCVSIDEVKDIRDKSLALQVYAYQAKDAELVAMSTELKNRAIRRMGELIEEQRTRGELSKGAIEKGVGRKGKQRGVPETPRLTLADSGIDKNLAKRARAAAAMSPESYEAKTANDVRLAVAVVQGSKEVITAARAERHEVKTKQREQRERQLAEKITALPDKKYGVILADPEWKFETWSPKGMASSSPDNHYKTSDLDAIKSRDVASIAAKDCVLFLWGTNPMLPQALAVMEAWGFKYVSNYVWVKHKAGTGYWNRSKHELLLIGTRGDIPAPSDGSQWDSVITAPTGRHSEKPDAAMEMIEQYYPTLPKIELNARRPRAGWDFWGTMEFAEAAE